LVLAFSLGLDALRPPQDQWATRAVLLSIDLYQATISKHLPALGVRCRFEPTCSHYGEAVIRRYGWLPGGLRAAWRILRCGPWTPQGTFEPPPDH
jgi:uncharacterized protein